MIETQSLTRRFGPLLAVDELTLSIPDGEIFGLLGPNGAGKTTTLRMLAGLIGITSGMAIVNGRDVADPAQAPAVRASLGLLPEENGLYSDLTVWQTLDFFARLHHVPDRRQRVRDLLQQMSMLERSDARVSTLSKGMKQRLAIATAEPPSSSTPIGWRRPSVCAIASASCAPDCCACSIHRHLDVTRCCWNSKRTVLRRWR